MQDGEARYSYAAIFDVMEVHGVLDTSCNLHRISPTPMISAEAVHLVA